MDNNFIILPEKITKSNIELGIKRTTMPIFKIILLGIFAGMFIACGASASSVAMHNIDNVGVSRLVGGCIFPVGLMMIVLVGGELFTGDCLMIMGVCNKKYSFVSMLRVLVIVYFSNLIGAGVLAFLVSVSGQFGFTGNMLGAFTIKVAMNKANISFGTAVVSGILCNIFVCIAVLMASASKDVTGKIWACFFPIMAFVVSGYEHCVANMYYIPAGIFALNNESYSQKAMEMYGYTKEQLSTLNWQTFFVNNEIPVTIGNVIGGMIFTGIILYMIHAKNINETAK